MRWSSTACSRIFPPPLSRKPRGSPDPRPHRMPKSAICGTCSGPRSTTTIRSTSISCRWRKPWPADAVQILVAIADVDALVEQGFGDRWACRDQHHVGLHAREDLSDAAGEAVDRPHVARRGRGAAGHGHRNDGRRRRHGDRRRHLSSHGAEPRQARLQQCRGMARWNRARRRPGWRRSPGSTSNCGCRIASRRRCEASVVRNGALRLEIDRGAAGVPGRHAGRHAAGRRAIEPRS